MNKRKLQNFVGTGLLGMALFITFAFLLVFIVRMFYMGFSVLSWEFISQAPRKGMTEGGIFPAIVGTFWLTTLAILIALPLGVFTAIYLSSYGKPLWMVRIVKIAINTLAGTPSIIYGLFGMAVFVSLFG
ncbi:MAG: hypothetical protein RBS43_00075, partial [Candidatus Cloacimonas sp.]|nr:hypothetical protein [Candidatus Cloacimonas sp.]